MLEELFLDSGKKACGNQGASSGVGGPSLNFEAEFGDEGRFRIVRVWLAGEFNFDGGGDLIPDAILEKFLAGYIVRVAEVLAVMHGFEPSVGNGELSLEIAGVSEVHFGNVFDAPTPNSAEA